MMLMAVIVFPEPDSPTSPRRLPGGKGEALDVDDR